MAERNLSADEIDAVGEQLRHEQLYASGLPLSQMKRMDAICAKSYRQKYTSREIGERLKWLEGVVSSGVSRPLNV